MATVLLSSETIVCGCERQELLDAALLPANRMGRFGHAIGCSQLSIGGIAGLGETGFSS